MKISKDEAVYAVLKMVLNEDITLNESRLASFMGF